MVDSMMQLHENALHGSREDVIKWQSELRWRLRMNMIPFELYAKLKLESDGLLEENDSEC